VKPVTLGRGIQGKDRKGRAKSGPADLPSVFSHHDPERQAREEEENAVNADAVPEVSAEEASELAEAGALLLDVREADEWDAGHAPEAQWIPMSEVQARIDELPRDRRIVAICRSGSRSRALAGALLGAGYDVVNVDGGMRAWAAEDLTVVASDGLPGVVI
jgi:rhodanese-related sulfurtransferase